MEHWLDAEGVCWDGYEWGGKKSKLTPEEYKAINGIYEELVRD